MLWIPQKGLGGAARLEHNTGTVGVATLGAAVTTGAASTAKGTAVELITATARDSHWITVIASDYGLSAAASEGCLDILVGAATEAVLIPNLLMGYCGQATGTTNQKGPKRWDFPLYIPAGSRIAAQAAGIRLSTALRVAVFLYHWPIPPFRVGTRVTTYGVTVPNGTAVTAGASGAEGAWTQITASTSRDHFCLVPSMQIETDTTTSGNRALAMDLGVGAATEEEIAQSYWFLNDGAETMEGPLNSMPCFQDIPASSRLVARLSNSGTNDARYGCAIHAVS
jgi:hypothetical protein